MGNAHVHKAPMFQIRHLVDAGWEPPTEGGMAQMLELELGPADTEYFREICARRYPQLRQPKPPGDNLGAQQKMSCN